jgi:hypothetical protein
VVLITGGTGLVGKGIEDFISSGTRWHLRTQWDSFLKFTGHSNGGVGISKRNVVNFTRVGR